jgi:hypothetical protein
VQVRAVNGTGTYNKYLTPPDVVWRFMTARSRKDRFFPED